eukprot:JP446971.1.p2 GENE.JP446971.1~~JP446971.1.p2  ORF type:complete len:89 (+),score=30.10 JP446971.1:57-323(+)
MSSFQIFIKHTNGASKTLDNILPTTTVAQLYESVRNKLQLPPSFDMYMVFGGKCIVEDDKEKTCQSFSIGKGSTLFLLQRVLGGLDSE